MPKLSRVLLTIATFAGLSSLVSAQTGPQLTVGPGLIYTVASRATNNLSSLSGFNAAVFKGPSTIYLADAHSEPVGSAGATISLANVYAVDLTSGQVTRVAGAPPNHTNGNIADCVPGTTASCPGDGGPATSAPLHEPAGLALDSAGNLFIADDRQNVIRVVNATTGIITTVAGTGAPGPGGDGGPANQAGLKGPTALAFDTAGNLYIADTLNHRIRRIAASSQIITTIAGTTQGFGGDNGPATSAQLNTPSGVAVDSAGNVFVADSLNHAVREVTGGNIYTVAGQGGAPGYTGDGGSATSARLQYPFGVAVDAGGTLYISDNNNNAIRKVTGDVTHTISTIAGNHTAGYSGDGGPALSASLANPTAISIDGENNLYFVDTGFTTVRRILSTAAPLTLPLVAAGSTSSSPFPLTLSNTSNQDLAIISITPPADFTIGSSNTCVSPLRAGASCTLPINFSPGGSTSGTLVIKTNAVNQPNGTTNITLSESNGLYFVPVAPCRVIDTRLPDPSFGGGTYTAGQVRTYAIRNSTAVGCSSAPVPANADVQAYSLNVTVVPKGQLQFLTVYPGDPTGNNRPGVSTLNSYDGRIKANAAIIPANTSDPNRSISIYANDPTDVIVDINGYYVPESTSNSLAFYPLPPCRAVDTRAGTGLLGQGQFLMGGASQDYPLTNVCSLPGNARAYALNYTAIPHNGRLGYLTTWPTGTTRPGVSTLNSSTGAVTANAAIVPVGSNGSVSAYSTDDADLIIDVAGYYAPPASSGLALYNISPCRAFDSRNAGSGAPVSGVTSENISNSCNVPATAQSYVLNTTVIPNGGLSYLTAWALGSAQPVQSVLNAYDAAVTSNLAVVPTVSGSVSTYAASSTGLILDLSAYFAP